MLVDRKSRWSEENAVCVMMGEGEGEVLGLVVELVRLFFVVV